MKILENKHIILGITGSIAAYKSLSLASSLTKAGALVDVILTESAAHLVTGMSFSAVTGRKAYQEHDLWQTDHHVLHIELGENNQAFLIAPATANTIAKLANGIADNFLTLTALASRTPLMVAPAMDGGMYQHPATQENLQKLADRGVQVIGPAAGHLASGMAGKGRMVEPEELLGHLRRFLGRNQALAGSRVLVTAGGTREPIDPVREIANRSSGKQGFALAQAAVDQGAEVVLITGPAGLPTPVGVERIDIRTSDEMFQAVMDHIQDVDVLIMAAAVADYRPTVPKSTKIKKEQSELTEIPLTRTPDILKEVLEWKRKKNHDRIIVVGFAAETEKMIENARNKLKQKDLDLIVANDISLPTAGFEVNTNQVVLLKEQQEPIELPLMSKENVAEKVVEEVIEIISERL